MESLLELDKELFLAINGQHAAWADPIMYYISQTATWIPLYLLLLLFIIRRFWNDSWAPLIGLIITIVIADQTMTAILKPVFQRLRPTRDPAIQHLVHIVYGYKGGLYGFASSHASNTFGVALFLYLVFRNKWMLLLFLWAAIVSYSRIYLGVHYPGDILGGIIVGIIAALIGWVIYLMLKQKFIKEATLPGSHPE